MKRISLCVVLMLYLFCEAVYASGQPFNNPFAIAKKTYIIRSSIDLKGQTVTIPSGSVVVFKKRGMIKNGILEGDGSTIKAGKRQIFEQVVLKGNFSAKTAYSEWFDIKSDCVLDDNNKYVSGTNNLQAFRNLLRFNNVSIKKGSYLLGGAISYRSGQRIEGNNAVLKFLTKNYCLGIDGGETALVNDVKINNLTIVGGKQEYTDKTEWWHGIFIGYAENISIENVTCSQCRGDGFYIGTRINRERDERIPTNIILNRVKASHNYRNGLSITRAVNTNIINSVFCYTSGTLPETGLDIEPNHVEIKKGSLIIGEIENITVSKCHFYGNTNEGFLIANQYVRSPLTRNIKRVQVIDCFFDDDITVTGCEDCSFERLDMKNSKVRVNGESIIKNLTLTGFNMVETEEGNDKIAIDLQYYRSKDWPVRSNIVISDMVIDGYGGAAINVGQGDLITYKKYDGLTISGCTIKDCGKGIKIGKSVKNLHIYDNKVDGKPVASGSVWQMGIPLFVFLLLATGGATFLIRKKKRLFY